jgi:hypothetical protein
VFLEGEGEGVPRRCLVCGCVCCRRLVVLFHALYMGMHMGSVHSHSEEALIAAAASRTTVCACTKMRRGVRGGKGFSRPCH